MLVGVLVGLFGGFQSRHFVLKDGILSYFKSVRDSGAGTRVRPRPPPAWIWHGLVLRPARM